jgi:hypothetical protein
MGKYRRRRLVLFLILFLLSLFLIISESNTKTEAVVGKKIVIANNDSYLAIKSMELINVKDIDPGDSYTRDLFGTGWASTNGCDTRNIILNRDLSDVAVNSKCEVTSGKLADPYTGKNINFMKGADTSDAIQIDHVVALSNAWQTGAQQLSPEKRLMLANDPLELLAVDGAANLDKRDGDASVWLPSNNSFRCQYVARQIAVKQKYNLWMTKTEKDAIRNVLEKCPGQMLPSP